MRSCFAKVSLVLVLITFLVQTLGITSIIAQDTETDEVSLVKCSSSTYNYSSGSQFESNLKKLLIPSLAQHASPRSYFNTSYGTDSDSIVYGFVQCRADVSLEVCQNCFRISTVTLQNRCPNKTDATIRYDKCMFRYSNTRFYSIFDSVDLDEQSIFYWNSSIRKVKDEYLISFHLQLASLFDNLTSKASSDISKFSTGATKYGNDLINEIHGLVDCTQDLSIADCSNCLKAMFSLVHYYCNESKGGWIISQSCEIEYDEKPFYNQIVVSPSPPASPLQQPLPPPSPIGDGKPSYKIGVMIGAAAAGIAVLLLGDKSMCLMHSCMHLYRRILVIQTPIGYRFQNLGYFSEILDSDTDLNIFFSIQISSDMDTNLPHPKISGCLYILINII